VNVQKGDDTVRKAPTATTSDAQASPPGVEGSATRGIANLASPSVEFASDFPARCDALVSRLVHRRAGREGAGRSSLLGPGEDFAGHRPYRPGEDLRRLDWDLLARLDKPFVRVERREAGERWTIWLDRSASMGVGVPGKLQTSAECAAALARVGLALGARVRVVISRGGDAAPRSMELRRMAEWGQLLAFLSETRAEGTGGLADLWVNHRPEGDRLFGIGDYMDGATQGWFVHSRQGRRIASLQVLAPDELAPRIGETCLIDAEDGQRLELVIDAALLTAYERRLEQRLEDLQSMAMRHRAQHVMGSSAKPFEEFVRSLLGD